MHDRSSLDFGQQDLRNCSFRKHNLSGANFAKADIRGCNFRNASLVGANFSDARAGLTWKQVISLGIPTIGVAALSLEAAIDSGFGALGKTATDPSWPYVVALMVTLSLAGIGSGIKAIASGRIGSIAGILSGVVSGAFLGFFYAGIFSDLNSTMAILGAVVGGLLMLPVTVRYRNRVLLDLVVAVAGTIFSYGFALFIGTWAIAHGSVGMHATAIPFGLVCLLYLWLTLESSAFVIRLWKSNLGTSFEGADLTDARFDGARLERTHFDRTTGYPGDGN
ncbi:MAG: pentapeptide repeat-containing protein [Cyanobacteriota bacterium]|nr:pentapeptide repeat-containing protein [Cyanobacteriota bacterium]